MVSILSISFPQVVLFVLLQLYIVYDLDCQAEELVIGDSIKAELRAKAETQI